jgi:hypothetical protein
MRKSAGKPEEGTKLFTQNRHVDGKKMRINSLNGCAPREDDDIILSVRREAWS